MSEKKEQKKANGALQQTQSQSIEYQQKLNDIFDDHGALHHETLNDNG